MEILQKITDDLEPLGGEMLLDEFIRVRRATMAARQAAAAAAVHAAQAAQEARAAAAAAQQPPVGRQEAGIADPAIVHGDVDAFMNREAIEGTSDDEIQEFMKERRGFDPTEY